MTSISKRPSITKLLMKELITSDEPTPEGSTFANVYQSWTECEGEARMDNLVSAYNSVLPVKELMYAEGRSLDVAGAYRKAIGDDDKFEQLLLEDCADRAAKALVVLDLFGETGVIELQTQYAKMLEDQVLAFEQRPPF